MTEATPPLSAAALQRLVLPAPAKLNLFLHITGRRNDGYHELQTLFQLLDYGDTVMMQLRDDSDIVLEQSLTDVPDEQNIVIQAARLLSEHAQADSKPISGVTIGIEKCIPMGGGLGGGSSNAASTLLGLNALWRLGYSLERLAGLGLQLGADVPVFIRGRNSFAEGVGERLQAVELPKSWFAVIKPQVSVPTGVIFSHSQLTRDTRAIRIPAVFAPAQAGSPAVLNPSLRNDCEAVVRSEYPAIDQAIIWLNQQLKFLGIDGAAQLTGTGACIFAQLATQQAAEAIIDRLPGNLTGFIAQGVERSTAHNALQKQNL